MNKIQVAYINNFNYALDINNLLSKTFYSTAGTAAYPAMTIPQTGYELLYKIPLRALYFLFSPFPWDIKEIKHTIGMIDGFFYIYLFYLVLRNIGHILNNEVLRIFLFIFISYIFAFSFGVGNFGTGIRHRTKFLVIIILLAAPLIKSISFVKKRVKN